jgi:hypothetical protein
MPRPAAVLALAVGRAGFVGFFIKKGMLAVQRHWARKVSRSPREGLRAVRT